MQAMFAWEKCSAREDSIARAELSALQKLSASKKLTMPRAALPEPLFGMAARSRRLVSFADPGKSLTRLAAGKRMQEQSQMPDRTSRWRSGGAGASWVLLEASL